MTEDKRDQVVVTDIRMPFGSMVLFMVKWAIAAIPAFLILFVVGAVFWSFIIGMFLSAAFGSRSLAGSQKQGSPAVTSPVASAPQPQAPDTSAYLSRVGLVGVRVGAGGTGKAVFGEVKNNGDRTLSKVEITIYCLSGDKKPVFEKTYTPVLVSSFSFGDANQPLKPGYSRKFGVPLYDAPSDWSGDVDVKVTSVEFAESKTGS